mgnify:FL=1|jgi:hypothetical protein
MANDNITIYNGEGKPETTREMTDAEMADRTSLASELSILRAVRNDLLAQTDFYANSDVTMSDDMKTYRQALRDITSGLDTIAKVKTKLTRNDDGVLVNFPTKPS